MRYSHLDCGSCQPLNAVDGFEICWDVHGRSGRVTLLRVNGMLAGLANLEAEERLRRVDRAVDWRSNVVDMLEQRQSFTIDQ